MNAAFWFKVEQKSSKTEVILLNRSIQKTEQDQMPQYLSFSWPLKQLIMSI